MRGAKSGRKIRMRSGQGGKEWRVQGRVKNGKGEGGTEDEEAGKRGGKGDDERVQKKMNEG